MAHFTLQINAGGGPVITVFVGVSHPRAVALQAAGQDIPASIEISALVDTGASCTFVDPAIVSALSITPTGSARVNTASSGATPHDTYQYDVALVIPAARQPLVIQTLPVVACELRPNQNFDALIGKDVLNQCLFIYNGAMGIFTLAY